MGDVRSLEALGIDISVCAPFIIPIVEEKLPGKVRSSIGDPGQGVYFALKPFTNGLKAYITNEEQTQIGIHPTSQQPPSRSVAARGIFHWGGKALKNWVWSEIAVAATPKSGIR